MPVKTAEQVIAEAVGEAGAKAVFARLSEEGFGIFTAADVVCATHNGLPMTDEEEREWDQGYDPCQFAVRVNEYGRVMSP